MINKHLDYIIVGQGLAGSVLSFLLIEQGYEVLVIDQGHNNIATKAAAGLINPITGRYYTKSWLIDQLLPSAKKTYLAIEATLDCKLWYEIDIYRALHTIEQVNDWSVRVSQPNYQEYAAHTLTSPYDDELSKSEGIALIKGGARVDLSEFITRYREHLKSKGRLLAESVIYDQIRQTESGIEYEGYKSKGIIFCEGAAAVNNPFFNYLPFAPAKGESLYLNLQSMNNIGSDVMKHQQYLVPIGNNTLWSGGGFRWQTTDASITEEFKESYKTSLDGFIKPNYAVIDHRAGIRPCVKDRKPLLGTHPTHTNIHLFNGMGTKGTSLAPFFANQFINHLNGTSELMTEVNLNRFK